MNILQWLDGKKTHFLAIFSAVNALLVASNVYGAEIGAIIQGLLSVLFSGAKVVGNKLGIGI